MYEQVVRNKNIDSHVSNVTEQCSHQRQVGHVVVVPFGHHHRQYGASADGQRDAPTDV